MDLVSIIVPMRNAEKWVEETIESIQHQSYTNWELLIVDDFSEDNSCSLVEQFVDLDMRVRLLKNRHRGIIEALQLAFNQVKGVYITRMDADDLMPPNRLKLMVHQLQQTKSPTIVTGKVSYFSDKPISNGYLKYEQWLNKRVENQDFYKHLFRECVVASPNWMGRTHDFKAYKLFSSLQYPEDYDLCFYWYQHDFNLLGLDEVTLFWREHKLRTSRNSEHYQQNSFFKLKINWFVKLNPHVRSIGIIGAGQKGKLCVKFLKENQRRFHWYDFNHEQFGSEIIDGQKVLALEEVCDELILIARYPENLSEIEQWLQQKNYEIGKTAFWV